MNSFLSQPGPSRSSQSGTNSTNPPTRARLRLRPNRGFACDYDYQNQQSFSGGDMNRVFNNHRGAQNYNPIYPSGGTFPIPPPFNFNPNQGKQNEQSNNRYHRGKRDYHKNKPPHRTEKRADNPIARRTDRQDVPHQGPTLREKNDIADVPVALNFQSPENMSSEGAPCKLYKCPKCLRHFDCTTRLNSYYGRIPLVLTCQHTVCQECIQKMAKDNAIVCPICKDSSKLPTGYKHSNLQEIFSPNFFLVGTILWLKSHENNRSISLAPVTDTDLRSELISPISSSVSKHNSDKTCCFLTCKKNATIQCTECNDFYCEPCCNTIHKSAKSMWSHNRVPLEGSATKKETLELERCENHNMHFEFYCTTCSMEVCCYCYIEQHDGHKKDNLLRLEEEEMDEFKVNKESARTILKQLIFSQKKLEDLSTSSTASIEAEVTSYFLNLHAKLQYIQNNLKDDIIRSTTLGSVKQDIKETYTEIVHSIENLKDIIIACDKVEMRKMNMRAIYNKLKEAKNTPCYLLSDKKLDTFEFVVNPLVDGLENYFSVDKNEAFQIKLVSEEDLPPDYEKDETDGLYQNDIENIIDSLGKSTITSNKDKSKKGSSKSSTVGVLEQESVEVTHIESLECFYVQLKKNQKQFSQMNAEIKEFIRLNPGVVDEPEINQLYLVKVLKEKIWCRGRITDIENGEDGILYNVFLIDYGSHYTLDKSKLRQMHVSLALKKPFAIQCELSNPSMRTWAKNAHVHMAKILNGRKVTMTVRNEHNGVQEVDLMILTSDRSQTSVIDLLIHACPDALDQTEDTEVVTPQKLTLSGQYKLFPNSVKFKKSQEANVRLASVIDPHHIFIHMASHIKFLENMNESLKNSYKNSREDTCVPVEGTYVVVNYKDLIRGNWHRGLVLKVNTDNCQVLLVDWGLELTVPWRDIRMLKEEFTRLEIQSISVKLAQVEPLGKHTTWTEAATVFLENFFLSQDTLKIVVHNVEPLEVGMFEMVGDVDICINAQLVKQNLADSTGKISQTLEWPKNDAVRGFREDDGILAQRLKQIESDDESDEEQADKIKKQKIEVVKLVNPGLIYIKFPAFESQAMKLHEELQIHYTKEHKTRSSWNADEQCVVFHNLSFARAKVLEKLDDRKYRVNIFDRATEDVINLDKMYEFDKYFTKFPNVVFKSHLANIKPAGGDKWSLSAIEALECVFTKYKEICGAKVPGDISGKSIPMNMWYTKVKIAGALEPSIMKFISLSNLLVKMGVAYKISSPSVKSESGSVKSERSAVSSKISNGNLSGLENDEVPVGKESVTSVESLAIPKNKAWSDAVEEEEETLKAVKNASDSLETPQEVDMDDWLPAFRIKQKEFYAWVTCADPGGILYLREGKLQSAYKEMETKMKEYFDKTPSASTYNDWDAGDLCTIYYNDMYYRGKIVTVKSQDDISVVMIDFGSDHTVTSKDLRQEILYPEIPAFASKIKLDKIYAKTGEWLDSDYQTLMDNVTEYSKIIIKSSLDDEIPTAEVFTDKEINLNQLLVQLCANLTRKLPNNQNQSEDDDILIEDDEPIIEDEDGLDKGADNLLVAGNQSVDTTKYKYTIRPLPDGTENVPVSILSVLKYNKVVLKEISTLSEELQFLNNEIQKTVHLQPVIENLETGMPCVCQFPEDKLWYRGEVYHMEDLDCGYVSVIFVDFGNVQLVTANEIKMMRPEWFATPVTCHIARLNIKIVEDKHIEHVTNVMKTLRDEFAKIITKDPLCVSLHKKDGALSYDSLIEKKLVEIV